MAEHQEADETEISERNIAEYKKAVKEEMNIPGKKVESKISPLTSIAIVLAVIVIVISFIFVFILRQRQVAELNAALERIEVVEKSLAETVTEQNIKERKRGILELRKALLSFQDAKNLITDDGLAKRLLKIEDDIKSVVNLYEEKESDELEAFKEEIDKPSEHKISEEETKK